MSNEGIIDVTEIRKAISLLKPNNQLFEVRIHYGTKKRVLSGYFHDADTLISAFERVNLNKCNVYISLQEVNEACYSREQSDRFVDGVSTTSDSDIDGYSFLFIDLDPDRAKGVSSTQDELNSAIEVAERVYKFLRQQGFEEPIKAFSGNGVHLQYPIRLNNTDENKELVHSVLQVLDQMFSTDTVKVDVTTFNPSRICKLYGTLAQKGTSTKDRPHRMSRISGDFKPTAATEKVYLQKVAEMMNKAREEITPSKSNNYSPASFDLEEWLHKYGITYHDSRGSYKGGSCTKYVLDECPFDSNHKSPDATIFKYDDGAIAFRCLHNHCRNYKWQDVRKKFEPDAYEKNIADDRIDEAYKRHLKVINENAPVVNDDLPYFETLGMILERPDKEKEYIQSGITKIDERMRGLMKGSVSVLSGLRGAAKSTILSQIMLTAIQNRNNVVCYSGELADKNFAKWMFQQAAGKSNVVRATKYGDFYDVPDEVEESIAKWAGEHLWLYNNDKGNSFDKISDVLRKKIEECNADLCVIDNLMALDLSRVAQDKYDAQTNFVWDLKDIAIKYNVHVIFVAHPRKANGFLRLDDISGSGNISNIVDNAFIVHRCNEDFKSQYKQTFKKDFDVQCTNVVEITKDRESGNQDVFIPLWYEPQTKRLKNSEAENIIYDWESDEQYDWRPPF